MAKGSHATWGGWESKLCAACGKKLTLSGKNAGGMFHRPAFGEPWSVCLEHVGWRPNGEGVSAEAA